jgi:alkylhydroperoxidase family enzyme
MLTEDKKRAAQKAQRRGAFENAGLAEPLRTLIVKVARQPTRISDEDVAAVTASGLSEDQVFELVVCAAVGQATRQYEAALGVLAAAMGDDHAP